MLNIKVEIDLNQSKRIRH